MLKVIKRDGRTVDFDQSKVSEAIKKAFIEVDGDISDYSKKTISNISSYIGKTEGEISVEEIQNIVEEKLMASKRKDVARKYIIYRDNRTKIRERNTRLMKEISEKISATNVQNQNANIDEKSFGGRIGEASDAVLKQYALDNCMSDMARENHLNNMIYIHDLNSYAVGMHNCMSIPFDKLLANGFNTRQTDVRPANSVNTAFQLVAVIFQLQSLQEFGGVSATHIDWTMVPYVRKSFYKHWKDGMKYIENKEPESIYNPSDFSIEDTVYKHYERAYQYAVDKTNQEIHQAVEGMYHNLNTLQSRSGNQLEWVAGIIEI